MSRPQIGLTRIMESGRKRPLTDGNGVLSKRLSCRQLERSRLNWLMPSIAGASQVLLRPTMNRPTRSPRLTNVTLPFGGFLAYD